MDYPLRSAALSIAFFLIALISLGGATTWRCIQWCASCKRCGRCGHSFGLGSEDTAFLGDTKHAYLKAWIYLLLAASIGLSVWGMLALDKGLLQTFWENVANVLDYGNTVSDKLSSLEGELKGILPGDLAAGARMVNRTLAPQRLVVLMQAGLGYSASKSSTAESLLNSTNSMREGLDGSVLPGVEELAVQLGASVGSGAVARRRLLAAPSYDTLQVLVPALGSSLPLMSSAGTTRQGVRDRLQELQAAMNRVQLENVTSADAPAVVALASALQATDLPEWNATLGQLAAALQVYNASRTGPAFGSVVNASRKVMAGAERLAESRVDAVGSFLEEFNREMTKGPSAALQMSFQQAADALVAQLRNISSNVATMDEWMVDLKNGTRVELSNLTEIVLSSLGAAFSMNFTVTPVNGSGVVVSPVNAFLDAMLNTSRVVSTLNTSAALLESAASSASDDAGNGPDPTAAYDQIESISRPKLADLTAPVTSVSVAMATYRQDATDDNLAELRSAALDASNPVLLAVSSFSPPLVNESGLADVANKLLVPTATLNDVGSDLAGTLESTYLTLQSVGSSALAVYEEALNDFVSTINVMPNVSDLVTEIQRACEAMQDQITTFAGQVVAGVTTAGDSINDAVVKLQDQILQPGESFMGDSKEKTEGIVDIAYPVWMACWGLSIGLMLGLGVAVWRNCPAGFVSVGLVLLVLLVLSQALTSLLAFGMAVLEDACDNFETVILSQTVEHSDHPKTSVLLSYYLYFIPNNRDDVLLLSLGMNTTDINLRLKAVNESVREQLATARYRGMTLGFLEAIGEIANSLIDLFLSTLQLFSFDLVHPLYINAKYTVCCDAGDFAYRQWCALTSAASICFGALVAAAYLLARMDMVGQRQQGCCSCCTCACYRPHDPRRADLEATEAAKRQRHGRLSGQQQHLKDKDKERHLFKGRSARGSQVVDTDPSFAVQPAEAGDPVVGAMLAPSPKAAVYAAPPPSPAFMVK